MKFQHNSKTALVVCLTLASGLLSACSSLRSPDVADAPPQIESGIWIVHSLKYPQRMKEMRVEAEEQFVGEPRPHPSRQRLLRLRETGYWITSSFTIASNEGDTTVYDAEYTLRDGRYHRLPKKRKDHYAGLVLEYAPGQLTVSESDARMLKSYAGNSFEPLMEDPLFTAIRAADLDAIEALHLEASDLNAVYNPLGRSPLFQAASFGHVEIVQALLDRGALADQTNANEYARTPIYGAIKNSQLEALQALLDAGADPNFQDSQGRTPLHVAGDSSGQFSRIVAALLKSGADPSIESKRGENVREELQRRSKHFLKLFEKEAAKLPDA